MGKRRGAGQAVDSWLTDFGAPPPMKQRAPRRTPDYRGKRARRFLGPGEGAMPVRAGIEQYRMTTDQAGVLWPFVSSSAFPPTGIEMGYQDKAGARFFFDPVGWTRQGIAISNTAVVCMGHPGRGKSAITKAFAMRAIPFGYRVMVLGDTKNEYDSLCRALGQEPFSVFVGGFDRINPLNPGPIAEHWSQHSADEQIRRIELIKTRWLALLQMLVTSQKAAGLPVAYGPSEDAVLSAVLDELCSFDVQQRQLPPITIPKVWYALHEPTEALWRGCRYPNEQSFLDGTRLLRDALGSLVKGRLKGLFDAETTVAIDWDAPIQSIGLAGLASAGEEAIAIALACINSWGTAYRMVEDRKRLTIDVRDELWRVLQLGPGAVHSVSADVRLSRSSGSVQWLTSHQPADFSAVGAAGSAEVEVGRSLIQMCATKILLGQEAGVARELDEMLDLGEPAVEAITGRCMTGKGHAVWCLGSRQVQVSTQLSPLELQLYNTNAALAG